MFHRSLAAVAARFSCQPPTRTVKNCNNPKKLKGEEKKRKAKTNRLYLYKIKTR